MENKKVSSIENEIEALEYLENLDSNYYSGTPKMSDDEYDTVRDFLNKKFNLGFKVGHVITQSAWPKENLTIHMGSLLKVNDLKDGQAWAEKYTSNNNFCVSYKADGSSLELTFLDGKFIKAITRGDGFQGENITKNAKKFNFPKTIDLLGQVVIRGEVIIFKNDFEKYFQGEKSARNSASGTMRRLDGQKCEYLNFLAFDIIAENKNFTLKSEKFKTLDYLGFKNTQIGCAYSYQDVTNTFNTASEKRESINFEIDGLVIEENNLKLAESHGIVDNRPRSARAFKFSNELKESVLLDVQWSIGKTGELTPTGIIKPTKIQGVTISRLTLNNFEFIKNLNLGINSKIVITRANDVIPKIEKALDHGTNEIFCPDFCPSCNSELDKKDLTHVTCLNDDCPSKNINRILHYVKTLDILGLGESTIETLFNSGIIKDIPDLYRLDHDMILLTENLSLTNIKKAEKELKEKSDLVPLEKFIASIYIKNVGIGTAKIITSKFNTLESLAFLELKDLVSLEGIGEKTAIDFLSGLKTRMNLIDCLIRKKFITLETTKNLIKKEGKFSNMFFCFTGLRDSTLENEILLRGGEITSSVTKKTTHVICDDKNSNSSKIVKARQNGLTILDVAEFTSLLK